MKKLNLLAVEASSQNLSLCVMKKGEIAVDFNRKIKFGASLLIEYIDKKLKEVSLPLKDIDAFVTGAGPGSFTGLRISFSIVKAFAIATGKPVISAGSFFACAYPFKNKEQKIAVVSDARRDLIYLACFKASCLGTQDNGIGGAFKREGREKLVKLEELRKEKERLFVTYDAHLRKLILDGNLGINFYPKDVYPKARYLLPFARERYAEGKFISVEKLKPLYLHPKTCQVRRSNT